MKENEFDIYVRNLMEGAEESVSPDLWRGVEAGLDRAARKRVVPIWVWRGLAGAGIAAAVAAAVVLLHPGKNLSNQPTIQPVAQATDDEPLPVQTGPEEETVIPVAQQVTRLKGRSAYVPETETPILSSPEEILTTEAVDHEAGRKPDAIVGRPDQHAEAFTSDEEAYRQLAFEEHKIHRHGHFSMSALGNIQSNTRPDSPGGKIRRSSGLFKMPAPTETGIYREGTEYSFGLPVSAGLSFRYDFNQRWGIGTGIVYTNLSRSFLGDYHVVENGAFTKQLFDTDITNQQHYVGIPLNLYFNIVNTGNWNFHVMTGGMAEKLVDNHFLIHDSEGDIHLHQKVDRPQFSVGVGVGVEFKFTPNVGIYFDPTLRYYFENGQPRSIRTIQPLRMDFEVGLRFTPGR